MPVMFPPGRAKLATRPSPRALALASITTGTVVVALLHARAVADDVATIRSTFSDSNSLMSFGSRSTSPSPNLVSMTMVHPSIQPDSLNAERKATSTSWPIRALFKAI